MATNTYVALDTQTLTSTAASVTFSTISGSYTDLVLVINAASSSAASCRLRFNGDTATNYSDTRLYGNGTSATSDRLTSRDHINCGDFSTTTIASNQIISIQNYSNATTYKTVLTRSNIPASYVFANVSMWRSTSAITSIVVFPSAGNLVAGSTFTLYGIANSDIGAPKAFGGTITQDAEYTYHTFGASGTFTPQQSLTCDYLVVAGGGGASAFSSGGGCGGGGAGGLRSTLVATGGGGSLESAIAVTAQAYTITVGAGGTYVNGANGNAGTNSTFSTITSTGGGFGAYNGNGGNGGSGGGGYGYPGTYFGGTGTTNQGFAGGNGSTDGATWTASAGGGGAGAVGATCSSGGEGGAGGIGVSIPVIANATGTGIATYYAGGGGGGTTKPSALAGAGGTGGGGNGGVQGAAGLNAITNTGGGGGGAGGAGTTVAGNGGSGVVIIRYAN